MVSQCEVNTTS